MYISQYLLHGERKVLYLLVLLTVFQKTTISVLFSCSPHKKITHWHKRTFGGFFLSVTTSDFKFPAQSLFWSYLKYTKLKYSLFQNDCHCTCRFRKRPHGETFFSRFMAFIDHFFKKIDTYL